VDLAEPFVVQEVVSLILMEVNVCQAQELRDRSLSVMEYVPEKTVLDFS
jgi:hypothetical protein